MILSDVELCRVFEREAPDGSTYLVGMLGDAGIAIVKDQGRPGAWRIMLSDPNRAHDRDDRAAARALAAPDAEGWYRSDSLNDDIPDEWTVDQSNSEGR
jgi:hypothetical protein